MVSLTQKAITILKNQSRNSDRLYNRFRITAEGGYYSVDFADESSYNDEVFEVDGVTIMIASSSMLLLDGAEIDHLDTPKGGMFTFSGPNLPSERSSESPQSITPAPKADPRLYVQSMPCRIDRNQERQYATELSTLHPGDVVSFPYDDVQYDAVVQRVNATNATVSIAKIIGSPRRNIVVGEKVHVAASILARGMNPQP
jgi:Fe-S cluster assembly iron-binding protein IscA